MTVNLKLTYEQILDLVKQMPEEDQERLGKQLRKSASLKELSKLTTEINRDISKADLPTEEEIINEVNEVRQEQYGKRQNAEK